jgi:hypothetical protein
MVVFRVRGLAVVCAALVCVLVAGQASGQPVEGSVPRVVRFDGVWTPEGGQAAGAETVTLAIYDVASGGAPLWEETQIVSVDATGHYAVLVGASRPEGLSPDLLASNAPRWLEVRFARSTAATPRVLLTSVPYALRASNADTLGGLPATAFLRATTPQATSADTATGDTTTATRTPTPAVNSGTANYIGKFSNSIDLTSSVMFENGGRIGVGTTSPFDTVHARFSDGSGTVTGYAVQNLSSGPGAYSGMLFYDHLGNLGQFQGFNNSSKEYRINNIATGGTINFMLGSSRFLVAPAGIGISNTSPQDALDVAGAVRASAGFRIFSGNTNLYGGTTTALDNLVLNWGLNDGLAGANVLGSHGGYFRIDLRSGAELQWWHKEAGTGVETKQFAITQTGILQVPSLRTWPVSTGTLAVYTDVNGNTGFLASSRRFKEDIEDMGDSSNLLMKLRPVTYHYKRDVGGVTGDGPRALEYGLIAEEVAEVYPDAVAMMPNGDAQTVQYNKINAMLLNEVQKQHRKIEELTARLAALESLLTTTPK